MKYGMSLRNVEKCSDVIYNKSRKVNIINFG
jgi:hypothetical protein